MRRTRGRRPPRRRPLPAERHQELDHQRFDGRLRARHGHDRQVEGTARDQHIHGGKGHPRVHDREEGEETRHQELRHCIAFVQDCRVPADNRIGAEGEGFGFAMKTLDGGRIGIAAQALGIAEASVDASLRYSKRAEGVRTAYCRACRRSSSSSRTWPPSSRPPGC